MQRAITGSGTATDLQPPLVHVTSLGSLLMSVPRCIGADARSNVPASPPRALSSSLTFFGIDLEHFEQKIAYYNGLYASLSALPDSTNVTWLHVDAKPMKESLKVLLVILHSRPWWHVMQWPTAGRQFSSACDLTTSCACGSKR